MSETAAGEKPKRKAHVSRFVWHVSIHKSLLPTIRKIIDVYQSVLFDINNAAEKPYVPIKGSI